jgi:hypothetical protein
MNSCKYRVYIDGHQVSPQGAKTVQDFDASAVQFGGNVHLDEVAATGLDPQVPHTLKIEPLFTGDQVQELHLESICVAGGTAEVRMVKGEE